MALRQEQQYSGHSRDKHLGQIHRPESPSELRACQVEYASNVTQLEPPHANPISRCEVDGGSFKHRTNCRTEVDAKPRSATAAAATDTSRRGRHPGNGPGGSGRRRRLPEDSSRESNPYLPTSIYATTTVKRSTTRQPCEFCPLMQVFLEQSKREMSS